MTIKIETLFKNFIESQDTLRIYAGEKLIFSSQQERLVPLLEFIEQKNAGHTKLMVFDRVIGNAAALLLTKIPCKEVYSPLGSKMAIQTLESVGIRYHFNEMVECIKDDSGENMCPMEKLSLGKNADQFQQALLARRQSAAKYNGKRN